LRQFSLLDERNVLGILVDMDLGFISLAPLGMEHLYVFLVPQIHLSEPFPNMQVHLPGIVTPHQRGTQLGVELFAKCSERGRDELEDRVILGCPHLLHGLHMPGVNLYLWIIEVSW
jgi:hypothetical protein